MNNIYIGWNYGFQLKDICFANLFHKIDSVHKDLFNKTLCGIYEENDCLYTVHRASSDFLMNTAPLALNSITIQCYALPVEENNDTSSWSGLSVAVSNEIIINQYRKVIYIKYDRIEIASPTQAESIPAAMESMKINTPYIPKSKYDTVHFEFNNWFRERDYPRDYAQYMAVDMGLNKPTSLLNRTFCESEKLLVYRYPYDMSINILAAVPREWLKKHMPLLLTEYSYFLRYPDTEDENLDNCGRGGIGFPDYDNVHFGLVYKNDPDAMDYDDE